MHDFLVEFRTHDCREHAYQQPYPILLVDDIEFLQPLSCQSKGPINWDSRVETDQDDGEGGIDLALSKDGRPVKTSPSQVYPSLRMLLHYP